MKEQNLFEQAAEKGATPSGEAIEAAGGVVEPLPEQPAKLEFHPEKFTNPETGTPYTFRDGSIFDPEKTDVWPKMKADGSPDLTVDGFLRKTNSGKNKTVFEKVKDFLKPKKTEQPNAPTQQIEHPKPDEILQEEQIIEKAAQTADADAERLRIEATRQQQLESQTSAKSIVALTQTIARAVGGAGATLDDEERKFLEGSVFRYEMITGHKLPLPPEAALIGDFASVYGAKFEKKEVKETFTKRWGFFSEKFKLIGAFLKGASFGKQPPVLIANYPANAPAAQPPAANDFPILETGK